MEGLVILSILLGIAAFWLALILLFTLGVFISRKIRSKRIDKLKTGITLEIMEELSSDYSYQKAGVGDIQNRKKGIIKVYVIVAICFLVLFLLITIPIGEDFFRLLIIGVFIVALILLKMLFDLSFVFNMDSLIKVKALVAYRPPEKNSIISVYYFDRVKQDLKTEELSTIFAKDKDIIQGEYIYLLARRKKNRLKVIGVID